MNAFDLNNSKFDLWIFLKNRPLFFMPFINVTIDEEIINLILAPQQMVPTSVCYFYNNKNSLRNNEKKIFKLTTRYLSYKKLELSRCTHH